jgi:hypothetical protein
VPPCVELSLARVPACVDWGATSIDRRTNLSILSRVLPFILLLGCGVVKIVSTLKKNRFIFEFIYYFFIGLVFWFVSFYLPLKHKKQLHQKDTKLARQDGRGKLSIRGFAWYP